MNGDNVYEVTVVASDGVHPSYAGRDRQGNQRWRRMGKLTVMPTQPRVGVELTAELTDSDGVVSGPTWQWYKETGATATAMPSATITDEMWEP